MQGNGRKCRFSQRKVSTKYQPKPASFQFSRSGFRRFLLDQGILGFVVQPILKDFRANYTCDNQKSGASALGLQRVLGLGSYRTAWNWLHKLRRAMVRPGRDALSGTVEVDETYVGGLAEGKRGRGANHKALVVIAAEEAGKG